MRMETIRPDPVQGRIRRALERHASDAGVGAEIASLRSRPWSSATFTGALHIATLACADGPARAAWLATLPDAEWRIPGHVVADLAIDDATPDSVTLALLMLAEA